tara:strand:+ start:115620 stop:116018 length:399 start_codon:yes stop_codon:yes gene_type:complete
MGANNNDPLIHKFEVVKYNKHDTIYQLCLGYPESETIKQLVKVEVFQNYSKAYNLGLYFRVKTSSSWKKSKALTGMFKTTRLNHYYGDYKTNKGKTLILFKIEPESQLMYVYEYPKGYYPSRKVIDSLINQI